MTQLLVFMSLVGICIALMCLGICFFGRSSDVRGPTVFMMASQGCSSNQSFNDVGNINKFV